MDEAAIAIEFLARFLADEEEGRVLPLREYLDRYRGHEDIVAEEYLRLTGQLTEEVPPEEHTDGSRYALSTILGTGGMGRVYLAHDRELDRSVALKSPHGELAAFESQHALLFAEARMTARLQHPALPPVHDLGVDTKGRPYYVMRRLDGENLYDVLARRRHPDALPLPRLLAIFQQASLAVAFAHSRQVLHLDLKPSNIMLGSFGELVVVDWGLARDVDGDADPRIGGTPGYMSPEQIEGGTLTPAADLFALGSILYEIVTETRAFPGTTSDLVLERTRRGVFDCDQSAFQRAPTELRALITRCLAVDPRGRPESASEVSEIVQRHLEGRRDDDARRQEADRALAQAVDLLHLRDSNRERVTELSGRLADEALAAWAPISEKRERWACEDEQEQSRRAAETSHRAAIERLTSALHQDPRHERARETLAHLFRDEILDAERTGHTFAERYYVEQLRALRWREQDDLLNDTSDLEVVTTPHVDQFVLQRLDTDHVLERAHSKRVVGTNERTTLPLGTYRISIDLPGYSPVVAPVRLRRGSDTRWTVQLHTHESLGDRYIVIPGDTFISGGDPDAIGSLSLSDVQLDAFAMASFPVTFAEYGQFLREQPTDGAERHAPRLGPGSQLQFYRRDQGYTMNPRRGSLDHGRWPVFGVSWHDAVAYALWKSECDGRTYSLPSGHEWEKAARGVDGRHFPWGNRFDAGLCKCSLSTRTKAQPEPVGSYRYDRSPYGVRDLAGGIQEWCRDWHNEAEGKRLIKGGSWNHGEGPARAATRTGLSPDTVLPIVGFRLVQRLEP